MKSTPISFIRREHLADWRNYSAMADTDEIKLSSDASKVLDSLKQWGASFFQDLQDDTRLLPVQLETALGELVAWGLITADSFSGLRTLITPQPVLRRRGKRRPGYQPLAQAGRWSLLRPPRSINPSSRAERSEEPAPSMESESRTRSAPTREDLSAPADDAVGTQRSAISRGRGPLL